MDLITHFAYRKWLRYHIQTVGCKNIKNIKIGTIR